MKKIMLKSLLVFGLFAMTFVFNSASTNADNNIKSTTELETTENVQSLRTGVHWKGLGGCRFNGEGCTVTICSGGSYCFHYW
jgi:hypothetical protein